MHEITHEQARDLLADSLADCDINADFVDELKPSELASEFTKVFEWDITIDTENNIFRIDNLP